MTATASPTFIDALHTDRPAPDRAGKAQRKLLERGAVAIVARGFGVGDQPHERR